MLFRHESYIRRGIRHEPVLIGCRIHPETFLPVMRVSRLAEPGRTCSSRVYLDGSRLWSLVRLSLAQHPIACLGVMAGDGDDGAAVAFAGSEPLIETFDMGAAIGLEPHGAGCGLDKAPLEILVDVAAGCSVPDAPAAGDDAGD